MILLNHTHSHIRTFVQTHAHTCTPTHPHTHLAGVLYHLDVLGAELVCVELEEPLGHLGQRGELGLLVDVLLAVLVLEEALQGRRAARGAAGPVRRSGGRPLQSEGPPPLKL